jgi:hypothetical protein
MLLLEKQQPEYFRFLSISKIRYRSVQKPIQQRVIKITKIKYLSWKSNSGKITC